MKYPEIAQRVFHTPLLAAPAKAASFVKGLGPRLLGAEQVEFVGLDGAAEVPASNKPYASLLDDRLGDEIRSGKRGSYRVLDGVAVIPITGTLIHRGAWVGSYSGETSYEGIGAQIDAASQDAFVRGIALEIDSHGGEVAGCFDLAARIRLARAAKPVQAFVCDHAYSAAYALASQADKIIVPRAGGVGSIGVICLHVDYSQHLDDRGMRVTVIAAGEHKADANPYQPLPEDVRNALAEEMETLRGIFAEAVSEGRGAALSTEAALETEAACFLGQDAVRLGLADEIASPRDAFDRFVRSINGQSTYTATATKEGENPMSNTPKTTASTAPDSDVPDATTTSSGGTPNAQSPASPDAPAQTTDPAAAATEPSGDPAGEERARVLGIVGCDEARGREDMAQALAEQPGMSVEAARSILSKAPAASATQPLGASINEEETDLDMPPATGAETANPVKAAQARRWN